MKVKLKVLSGKHAGQEIAVSAAKFFIGRAEDCHLRPGSDLISRHHCALMVEEGYAAIRDFGSKNGTYLNGERLVGEREIKSGDMLKVGPLEFEVAISVPVAGDKRPPVADMKEAAARTVEAANASAGSSEDDDIGDWLADDEPESSDSTGAKTETVNMRFGDTEAFKPGSVYQPEEPPQVEPEKTPEETPEKTPEESPAKGKRKRPEKKKVGKLPKHLKEQAKDSQAAANSILDSMRRHR